ncbi:hypothetical protein WH95_05470 [Kiloniella litopenaei]|uniref:Uncharacterized protein n=1 Tax=Kiloniella litopenaei TaxID=1549748 RepID=A0A0M2RE84_9PROT|nr:hypothetical protein [Kiloniella litopenaei]KKJ77873.1 hypothetical protein WH95_05470 [Kiloniella litopenaei]
MIPTLAEIKINLNNALQYMRFNSAQIPTTPVTAKLFWQSFFAAVLCLPGTIYVSAAQPLDTAPTIDLFALLLIDSLFYIISWVAYPVMMHLLLVLHKKEKQFGIFIIHYNWLQVWQSVIFVLLLVILQSHILPDALGSLVSLICLLYILATQAYMTKITLETGWFSATAFVFFNIVLAQAILALNQDMMYL